MKLLPIEEKLIAVLTKIVWWFDVKWNRGTLFVFFFISFIIPTLLGFFFTILVFTALNKWYTLPLFLGFLITFENVVFVFLFYSYSKINAFEEADYSPNPNLENGYVRHIRLICFLFLMHIVYMFLFVEDHQGYYSVIVMLSLFVLDAVFTFSALYVLCVDPFFPDEEEEKQIKETQPQLQLSPNAG
jgi:hypothetical protein